MNSLWTKFKESKSGIFLANPIVGLVLSCALAIIVSYYFYNLGDKSPDVVLRASPVRSSIVKTGGVSDLSVSFRGKEVTSDLTVMQVAIWNTGKASVRHENILEPISISSGTNVPIYSATIRTISRSVVGFTLITNELNNGKLIFDWKIMEHNDGASIQILYGGNQDVEFKVDGIIEGQDSIKFSVASESSGTNNKLLTVIFLGMLAFFFLMSVWFIRQLIDMKASGRPYPTALYVIVGGISLLVLVYMCIWGYMIYGRVYLTNLPPFGF